MSLNQSLIAELRQESAATSKMLSRVPCDKNTWRPHEKSMALGNLSAHVSELSNWITDIVKSDELDFAKREYKPFIASSAEELVNHHNKCVSQALEALEGASDAELDKPWTLRNGDHVIFTMPKKVAMRSFAFNHMYHHRGQLSVYLRLLDVPVPGMYGPSKDDSLAQQQAAH